MSSHTVTRYLGMPLIAVLLGAGTAVPVASAEVDVARDFASASGGQRACVSNTEFRRVKVGMAMHRVHSIYDTKGHRWSGTDRRMERWYPECVNEVDRATAVFRKRGDTWRLRSKTFNVH